MSWHAVRSNCVVNADYGQRRLSASHMLASAVLKSDGSLCASNVISVVHTVWKCSGLRPQLTETSQLGLISFQNVCDGPRNCPCERPVSIFKPSGKHSLSTLANCVHLLTHMLVPLVNLLILSTAGVTTLFRFTCILSFEDNILRYLRAPLQSINSVRTLVQPSPLVNQTAAIRTNFRIAASFHSI